MSSAFCVCLSPLLSPSVGGQHTPFLITTGERVYAVEGGKQEGELKVFRREEKSRNLC